jgi:ABC-type multidrug transport system fused ATPase/permease subunit
MTIPKGKVVALVGHNGAGKSTLVNILMGLYHPTSGSVNVVVTTDDKGGDDHTTADVDPNNTKTSSSSSSSTSSPHEMRYPIRSNTSHPTSALPRIIQNQIVQVVPQTTSLFNMSIYDNVQYSNKYATEQDVIVALQDADCYDWAVNHKAGGIHTKVGKNGNLLSGGENQKIGIARALLNHPHFLILDEPTTHIDQNSNTKISKNILQRRRRNFRLPPRSDDGVDTNANDSEFEKRGILLVTHDVKTILEYHVDYVYVMKHGQIVEHNALEVLRSNRDSELCQLMPKLYHGSL